MSLPALVPLCVLIANLIVVGWKLACRKSAGDQRSLWKHVDAGFGFIILAWLFLYILVVGKGFEIQQCRETGEGPVLRVDPQIECGDDTHSAFVFVANILLLIYGLGIPVLFGVLLWRYGPAIQYDQALRERGMAGSRDTNAFFNLGKRLRRLYFKYKSEAYYWSELILLRKALLVVVAAQLFKKPLLAASAILCSLFVAYTLQLLYNPYRSHTQEKAKQDAQKATETQR